MSTFHRHSKLITTLVNTDFSTHPRTRSREVCRLVRKYFSVCTPTHRMHDLRNGKWLHGQIADGIVRTVRQPCRRDTAGATGLRNPVAHHIHYAGVPELNAKSTSRHLKNSSFQRSWNPVDRNFQIMARTWPQPPQGRRVRLASPCGITFRRLSAVRVRLCVRKKNLNLNRNSYRKPS